MIRKGIHFSSQNWKIVSLISVGSWILILLRPGVCQPRLRTWWEKQIFQRDFQKFTALMPLLVSSEHICCAWHGQSKYFYSSVVLENDVYSNPGDGCQPRLNTVFLIVFFFLYSKSFVWVLFCLCKCGWIRLRHVLVFFGSHQWFAATVKLLGFKLHLSESLLHMCRGSEAVQGEGLLHDKTRHISDQTSETSWSFVASLFNYLSASHNLSSWVVFEPLQ